MSTTAPATVTIPRRREVAAISTRRRVLVWALIVVAAVVAFLAVLTTWVNRQLLSNESWRHASQQVIQDPKVQDTFAVYTVNQLYGNVDVQARLAQQLPPNLDRLAGPLSAALRQPAVNAVGFLLERPRIQEAFVNASALAHQKLVNVLKNETGHGISSGNGVVTLDLHALVQELGRELGLPAAALDRVPKDAGVITVMKSDQLKAAQTGVRLVHALSVWLLVLVFVLDGLAIYLATGRRRATLRAVGWAWVLVGLLALVVRRVVGNYAIAHLAPPAYQSAGHATWLIISQILANVAWATILYGAFAVIGATLAGPTRAAVWARRKIAPVLNGSPSVVVGTAFAILLLLVLWGPTHALRTWWGVLLVAVLFAIGIVALRRQTLREFAAV